MNEQAQSAGQPDTAATETAPPIRHAVPEGEPLVPRDEVDPDKVKLVLDTIRQRFVDERATGFTDTQTGKVHAPITREEAERHWPSIEDRFRRVLEHPTESLASKLGLRKRKSYEH